MRGEHVGSPIVKRDSQGSSPHARGTPGVQHRNMAAHGIIPACAGNTIIFVFRLVIIGDHPRMRGEHYRSRRFCEINQGSSPHARGTRASESGAGDEDGIIPACAGNTFPVARICLHLRDHPRMRGEHPQPDLVEIAEAGSSPHARGTPCRCLVWHPSPGIIPACAGNTKTLMYAFARLRDHPRMRGEHPLETFADRMKLGSSPHARGTRALIVRLMQV